MQSPLIQDGGTDAPFTRIVKIDIRTGAVREYAYELTNIGTAAKPKYGTISEILAINNDEFLVDERDGKGLADNSRGRGQEDLPRQPQERDGSEPAVRQGSARRQGAHQRRCSSTSWPRSPRTATPRPDIPAKLEGITFGPDITANGATRHTLIVSNDNDFLETYVDDGHPQGGANPNRWFVFALDDSDLPGYKPQPIETTKNCSDDHRSWDEWFRGRD